MRSFAAIVHRNIASSSPGTSLPESRALSLRVKVQSAVYFPSVPEHARNDVAQEAGAQTTNLNQLCYIAVYCVPSRTKCRQKNDFLRLKSIVGEPVISVTFCCDFSHLYMCRESHNFREF